VTDLYNRMAALAQAYQDERPDLEPADLMALTIRALLRYSVSSVSSIKKESAEDAENCFETATITDIAKQLAQDQELGLQADEITTRRVGRVFGRMRLREKPRIGSGGKRQWICTKGDLRRWLLSYGMSLPEVIFADVLPPSPNGANGVNGANGAVQEEACNTTVGSKAPAALPNGAHTATHDGPNTAPMSPPSDDDYDEGVI
jgi:hypothetical protein